MSGAALPIKSAMTTQQHYQSALWPEGEQLLLLRAALLDGKNASAAFQEWSERVVFDDLDQASFRLIPLLRSNLRRLSITHPLTTRIESVARYLRVETTMKLNVLGILVSDLTEISIPGLLLKGAAIGQQFYPHPSLRPMADCDVLIRMEDRDRALAHLEQKGWKSHDGDKDSFHYSRDIHREEFPMAGVELHWRSGIQSTLRDDVASWKNSREINFKGNWSRVFCPEDEIVHACRHGYNWIAEHPPMRWLVDCTMIIRSTGPSIDWHFLAKRARDWEETLAVRESLEWVRRETGTDIPSEALKALAKTRISGRVKRLHVLKGTPRDWAVTARLYAEYLRRELPIWKWPFQIQRVLGYFSGQFMIPDHGDAIRYFLYHFWQEARASNRTMLSRIMARILIAQGARSITWRLVDTDYTAALEEPTTFCWGRHKLLLSGFTFANESRPHPPLRVMRMTPAGWEKLPTPVNRHVRVDIARVWPMNPSARNSGFTALVELPSGEVRLRIEYFHASEWNALIEVDVAPPIYMRGFFLPKRFPQLQERVNFGDIQSDMFLPTGWSRPEGASRWSDGSKSIVIFRLDTITALTANIELRPLLIEKHVPRQRVQIFLNGGRLKNLKLSHGAFSTHEILLPKNKLLENNVLSFHLPDSRSPKRLGLNSDTRNLGILVQSISFCRVAREVQKVLAHESVHRIKKCTQETFEGLFDPTWYLQRYPDVASAGIDPLTHYVSFGAKEKRSPHPLFDAAWYLERYPEASASDLNPLLHYLKFGAKQGFDPNPLFDSAWYLSRHPGSESESTPLHHYLRVYGNDRTILHRQILEEIRTLKSDESKWPPLVRPSEEAGIVITACGRLFKHLFANIRIIRMSGCDLPIDVWYLPGEFTVKQTARLGDMANLICAGETPFNHLSGKHEVHGFKAWMLSQSRFKKTLMLDVNSFPIRNPKVVFESGANCVLWRDAPWGNCLATVSELRGALGLRIHNNEFESGQLYADKDSPGIIEALRLSAALNMLGRRLYNYTYGDKETYSIALELLDIDFLLPPPPKAHNLGLFNYPWGGVIQPWVDGNGLFYHPFGEKDHWHHFKNDWIALETEAAAAELSCQ